MTAPLTPADCDLRDFQFMPVDIVRLFSSEFHARATDGEWRAGVTLWLKSFHQVPAASLPDDDVQLARLAEFGRDLASWREVRDGALHGWVKCEDGRFYHPVVAEKAREAFERKRIQRERSRRGVEARQRAKPPVQPEVEPKVELKVAPQVEPVVAPKVEPEVQPQVAPEVAPPVQPQVNQGTGTGTGTVKSSVPIGTADAEAPARRLIEEEDELAQLRALPIATGSWRLALMILVDRGGMSDAAARTFLGKFKAAGLTPEDQWQIAEAAWIAGTHDPKPYFAKAAEEAIQRRTGAVGILDPSEKQQRYWLDEWRRSPNSWKPGERGPRPGEAGCRISAAILAEHGIGARAA